MAATLFNSAGEAIALCRRCRTFSLASDEASIPCTCSEARIREDVRDLVHLIRVLRSDPTRYYPPKRVAVQIELASTLTRHLLRVHCEAKATDAVCV